MPALSELAFELTSAIIVEDLKRGHSTAAAPCSTRYSSSTM